ncbi:MAG: cupin-like domain-containing protein [Nitrososphaerales archaeon]
MTGLRTIARVNHPLPLRDFYLDYFIPRQPVIIRTNTLADLDWRTDRWTNEYLVYKAGGQSVAVLTSQKRDDFMPERAPYGMMPFQEFIARVMANPDGDETLYLNLQDFEKSQVLEAPLLQLIGDFSIPVYFKDLILRCMNIWMGNSHKEVITPLHHDFNDNLYAVVEGHKHFTLFPPQQVVNLYTRGKCVQVGSNGTIEYESLKGMPHLSQIDIDHPDLSRFPQYANAVESRFDFDLDKNEILFLPNGWFHRVSSLGRHIAVSFMAVTPTMERLQWMRSRIISNVQKI